MTKRMWFVSVIAGLILGVVTAFADNDSWFKPTNAFAVRSVDNILQSTLNSHTKWASVKGIAEYTMYDPEGNSAPQHFSTQIELAQPAMLRLELLETPLKGGDDLWIIDGKNIFSVNGEQKKYSESKLPRFAQDFSKLPKTLGDVEQDFLYPHPFAMVIPSPVAEYLFPHWYAQARAEAVITLVREDEILGRAAWVLDYTDGRNHTISWIDQKTGVILKYFQEIEGRIFLEFEFTSLVFNVHIPAERFVLPDGLALVPNDPGQ